MGSHGQSNKVMNRGKNLKDDEFYTTEKTVNKIMSLIDLSELKDKIVWCPFGTNSEFVKFFRRLERERERGIKELIATGYNFFDKVDELKRADIIIDNVPFSIQNKIIALLERYNKKYLLIVAYNSRTNMYCWTLPYISVLCTDMEFLHNGKVEKLGHEFVISNCFNLDKGKKKLDPNKKPTLPYNYYIGQKDVTVDMPFIIVSDVQVYCYNYLDYFYIVGQFIGDRLLPHYDATMFRRTLLINKKYKDQEKEIIELLKVRYPYCDVFIDINGEFKTVKSNVKSIFEW